MSLLSKEERVFVEEKYHRKKATWQLKQHFGNDLIMYHFAKRQTSKTLEIIVEMQNRSKEKFQRRRTIRSEENIEY